MITPNKLTEAKQEIQGLDLGKFKIPTEMQLSEKDYYYIVGLNSTDTVDGMGKIATARAAFFDIKQWDRMAKDLASKHSMFKVMGANAFKKVIILHNPTLSLVNEKPLDVDENGMFATTGRMTPTKKETINKLMKEGKGADDFGLNQIAKDINVPFAIVKEYVRSF